MDNGERENRNRSRDRDEDEEGGAAVDMVNVFKALGDSTRREILKLLNQGDMTAGEISDQFSMSKPAITKHLDILRNAELVTSRKVGVNVIYSINVTVLQEVLSDFLSYFDRKEAEEDFPVEKKFSMGEEFP